MLRMATRLLIAVAVGAGFASLNSAHGSGPNAVPILTARPVEEITAVLHNPDVGWVLYENYPLDPEPKGSSTLLALPEESFPDVDAVALMASWQDIEKSEGVFDFSRLDFAHDYWTRKGKSIQLRVSTESLLWWTLATPAAGRGIPDSVLAGIPASKKQTRHESGIPYVVVDARDPTYLKRLDTFLAALASHFSAERHVTLVDLRGFGLWGEWHTGYRYPTVADRHQALSGIIDHFADAFPKHRLALSFSYDPDSPARFRSGPTDRFDPAHTSSYRDFLHFSAFDHALTKKNVTWRRDGAGGAVHSNERRLIDEAFFSLDKGPIMAEFLGGYAQAKKGGHGHVDRMIDDAISLHPNYMNLLGWQGQDALDFVRERPDLIALGLRTMGYRLVPLTIRYPESMTEGRPFPVEMEWVNRGVGRAMRDFRLRLTLADATGRTLAVSDMGPLETSRWVRDRTYQVSAKATFDKAPPGDGSLRFSLIDPLSGKPIDLPLTGGAGAGEYPIGGIRGLPKP